MTPFGAAALAALVAALLTPLVIRLARRADVMDHPGPLKPHAAPVPYLGGLAVFGGAAAGLVGSAHLAVLLPLAGALALGVGDDIASLGVLPRFAAELAIGAAVAWSVGLDVSVLAAIVVVGTIVMINAVNFVDGLDALAAGVCAVSAIGLALVLGDGWSQAAAAVAGAAVGFLVFNRPPARVYLGDAGSYLLGTALAVGAAAYAASSGSSGGSTSTEAASSSTGLLGTGVTLSALAIAIALLGYPVVELVSTVGRRLVSRRPLFAGDRDHVYDQLRQRGMSGPATAAALISAQAVVVGVGVIAYDVGTSSLAIAAGIMVIGATALASLPRGVTQR